MWEIDVLWCVNVWWSVGMMCEVLGCMWMWLCCWWVWLRKWRMESWSSRVMNVCWFWTLGIRWLILCCGSEWWCCRWWWRWMWLVIMMGFGCWVWRRCIMCWRWCVRDFIIGIRVIKCFWFRCIEKIFLLGMGFGVSIVGRVRILLLIMWCWCWKVGFGCGRILLWRARSVIIRRVIKCCYKVGCGFEWCLWCWWWWICVCICVMDGL